MPSKDLEKRREANRAYRARNRERLNAASLAYCYAHKAEMSAASVGHMRRKRFGVSPEQYDEMLKRQGGVCAICGTTPEAQRKTLAVDHNHATGRVRGLLCSKCNLALGHLRDDVSLLRSAIQYLKG